MTELAVRIAIEPVGCGADPDTALGVFAERGDDVVGQPVLEAPPLARVEPSRAVTRTGLQHAAPIAQYCADVVERKPLAARKPRELPVCQATQAVVERA